MTFVTQGSTLNNVDSKDIQALAYAQTGLGAQTDTVLGTFDGRTFRDWTFDVRYTAGGTLALTIDVSNEDVAVGSVSTWQPATKMLIDRNTGTTISTANVASSGSYQARIFARWVRVKMTLTGTGNSVACDVWKGWG